MKRVLFVDDDATMLDGLRARLHGLRREWEMVFIASAPLAIAEIEHQPFDVVVSDLRMPEMNGAQLLEVVQKRWPECIRIVLSGYAAEDESRRVLPLAHQYLSKPCDANQLEAVIGRCMRLHEVLRQPALRSIVGKVRHLPALPQTYTKLREVMSLANASVDAVAAVIACDTALTAKLMQVVNSAFFRRAREVKNIAAAVAHLGFGPIANIVMSVELFSEWHGTDHPASLIEALHPARLQAHAQKVAAVAYALTAGTPVGDNALLAGLLHNIGYWILIQECPDELRQATHLSALRGSSLFAAELEVFGASHAEVGAYLLGLWGLPAAVIEAVALQHRFEDVPRQQLDVLAALVLAHSLVALDDGSLQASAAADRAADYMRAINAPFDWQEAQRRASVVLRQHQP